MRFLSKNERNNLVPKLLSFAEIFCFASLPHPVLVGGVMQDTNVTLRHQAIYYVTCDVTNTIKLRFIN